MSARAIWGICIVGVMDLAYRLFLRGMVRERIGMDTRTRRFTGRF
jgi:hypothetical protein